MDELLEECLEERAAGWPGRGWFTAFFHAVYVVVVERSRVPPTATTTDALLYTCYYHQPAPRTPTTADASGGSFISLRLAYASSWPRRARQANNLHSRSFTQRSVVRSYASIRDRRRSRSQSHNSGPFRPFVDSPTARANIYSDASRPTRHRLVLLTAIP